GAHDLTRFVEEGDPLNAAELARSAFQQVWHELLERQLALADGDHVGAAGQVLVQVVGRVRPIDYHQTAGVFGRGHDTQPVRAGHQVAVDAHHRRPFGAQVGLQGIEAGEGRVEEVRIDAVRFEGRVDVE